MKVNPYLFLLSKRMVEFEVANRLDIVPSISAIVNHVMIDSKQRLIGLNKDRISENLRRRVWGKKSMNFQKDSLDYIARIITSFGKFNNWDDFNLLFSNDKYALLSESFDKDFYSLNKDDQQLIKSWVERRIGNIYWNFKQEGKTSGTKSPILTDIEEGGVIRTAIPEDIEKIANLAKRVYPCPINDFNVKLPWYRKNPNIFVVYIDEWGELIANINLLPLKNDFFKKLKSGEIYEDAITDNDIYSTDEKNNVKYIYVEGFASLSTAIQNEFRRGFGKMISNLANIDNGELVICSIGGSKEGDAMMKSYKFERTSWAVDSSTGKNYPFFEITWLNLQSEINKKLVRHEY